MSGLRAAIAGGVFRGDLCDVSVGRRGDERGWGRGGGEGWSGCGGCGGVVVVLVVVIVVIVVIVIVFVIVGAAVGAGGVAVWGGGRSLHGRGIVWERAGSMAMVAR